MVHFFNKGQETLETNTPESSWSSFEDMKGRGHIWRLLKTVCLSGLSDIQDEVWSDYLVFQLLLLKAVAK